MSLKHDRTWVPQNAASKQDDAVERCAVPDVVVDLISVHRVGWYSSTMWRHKPVRPAGKVSIRDSSSASRTTDPLTLYNAL